jgi:hypothetical protein
MAATDWWLLRQIPVVFARGGMMLSKYWDSETRRGRLNLLLDIRSKRDMLLLPSEACQIMSAVDAVRKVPGEMAELGVASGSSAKMISARAPDRILHLFDTFEGIPKPGAEDSTRFKESIPIFARRRPAISQDRQLPVPQGAVSRDRGGALRHQVRLCAPGRRPL